MVAGFVILRWIDPERMGLWQSLLLVQTYSAFAQLGVFNGLNRELPFRLGKGDTQATELVSTGQGFSWILTALLLLGALISVFISDDPNVRYVLPAAFIAAAASMYMQFLGTTYRAGRVFRKLAVINVIDSGLIVATLPIVYFLGYPGLPIRHVALALVATATRHIWRPFRVPTRLNLRHLGTLLQVGVPLFAFGYMVVVANSFPTVVLLTQGGAEMVGLFSPAAAMMSLMIIVPQAIAYYVYPQMSFRLGETGDPRTLWPMAWKASLGFMAFGVPLLLVAVICVPPLIKAFLPEYVASIDAVLWTLLAGLFIGASISTNALNSLKAWRWVAPYTLSRLALSFFLPLAFFYAFANHVEGVAFGYAIAQMLCFVIALGCVHRATLGKGG
jgi:O-antigen/teichoic acid export membrane protein